MPSVMGKLKGVSSDNTAKRALNLVMDDITTVHSAGAMPRGRQQVNDIRKKHTTNTDPLFTLMMMCKGARRRLKITKCICAYCN